MARISFLKAFGGAAALLAGTAVMSAGAQAQWTGYPPSSYYHECDAYDDYGYLEPGLSECGEAGIGMQGLASSLAGLSDAWGNQMLNFGGFAGFTSPTGRVRHTNHDGLRDKTNGGSTGEFEVDEASFFGNVTYDLPGTYFGGKVRVSGMIGYNWLTQDNEAKTFKNEIDALIYGGSYLWTQGSFYSMSMIIGVSGETDATNGGGKYNYDISGYLTNSVMGYTFDMAGGWKFDVRGNLTHYDIEGDDFTVPTTTVVLRGEAEGWSAGITGTVFTVIEMGGGVARPYISAQYKNMFDEDIKIRGGTNIDFDQDDSYGKLEAGYDFVQGPWTYGAALYTEFSGDQETVGGRVGISLKLQ